MTEPESAGVAGRATLEDVAARAGVSRATVSRVVNDSPRVSPDVRARVEACIDAMGYAPNRAARSLAGRRSETIALVVSEPSVRLFADPFFAGTTLGVTGALSSTGYQLVLMMVAGDDDRARVERHLCRGGADGALLLSARADDPLVGALADAGVPCVVAGRPRVASPTVGWVDADNVGGAETAVAHLLASGRRTVGTVAGPGDMTPGVDRRRGWERALAAAGRPAGSELAEVADFTRAGGEAATRRLLARRPDLDGLFVASDLMALGALDALRAEGRAVPDDVAVVGFDDTELARTADPPLTTVRQPIERLGAEMARLLLERLTPRAAGDGEGPAPDDEMDGPGRSEPDAGTGEPRAPGLVLRTELVIRRSG